MPKLVWKPGALLSPVPAALVSCGTLEHPNLITIGWTGIACTSPAMTYVSIRPERYSHSIIEQSGEFVINLTTEAMVRAVDFCGVRSGRDIDKFAACALTPAPCSQIDAPLVQQAPVSIECVVKQILRLGSHDMFLSEIVAVQVEESLLDKNGRLALDRAQLAAYAHGTYYALGKQLGNFGFSVRKKPLKSKPRGKKPPKGK